LDVFLMFWIFLILVFEIDREVANSQKVVANNNKEVVTLTCTSILFLDSPPRTEIFSRYGTYIYLFKHLQIQLNRATRETRIKATNPL
jgi:hypothetical protein